MVQKNKTETRSQDLPNCYIDAGQFYFAKKQNWIKSKTIFTPNSTALIRKKVTMLISIPLKILNLHKNF